VAALEERWMNLESLNPVVVSPTMKADLRPDCSADSRKDYSADSRKDSRAERCWASMEVRAGSGWAG